jgi:nucleoside-diphosphate-sugar epimerase
MSARAWLSEPGTAIAGAAGGMGEAIVRTLADQGWQVVATDLKPRPSWLAAEHAYVEADITDRERHREILAAAAGSSTTRWVVVHAAGGSKPGNYLVDDPESWETSRRRVRGVCRRRVAEDPVGAPRPPR